MSQSDDTNGIAHVNPVTKPSDQGQQEGIPSLYEYLIGQEPNAGVPINEDEDLRAETD